MKKPIKRSGKTKKKTKGFLQENQALSEKLEKAIGRVKSLGPNIKEDFRKLSEKGGALRSSITDKARRLGKKKSGSVEPETDHAQETNQRLHELIRYFEDINEVFLQTIELTRNMNDTIIRISTDARESSRKSFSIATAALVISAISLTMSAIFSFWNYQSAQENQVLVETFVGHVEEMRNTQEQQNEKIIEILEKYGNKPASLETPDQVGDN